MSEGNGIGTEYLQTAEAGRMLKCSRRTLQRYVKQGLLTVTTADDGSSLYSIDQLQELAETLNITPEEPDKETGEAQLIRAYAEREKVLLDHERKLVDILFKGHETLRLQNADLMRQNTELYKQAQEGLNAAQDREIAQIQAVRAADREQTVMNWLNTVGSQIVAQVKTSGAAAKLVSRLPEDKVELLRKFLTPDEFALLLELRGRVQTSGGTGVDGEPNVGTASAEGKDKT